ncbi:MAG: hypothetical protein MJB14_16740 [Spirochaetes bacterium]|nr:hypothetical protein [Spirochaetota bacterium]
MKKYIVLTVIILFFFSCKTTAERARETEVNKIKKILDFTFQSLINFKSNVEKSNSDDELAEAISELNRDFKQMIKESGPLFIKYGDFEESELPELKEYMEELETKSATIFTDQDFTALFQEKLAKVQDQLSVFNSITELNKTINLVEKFSNMEITLYQNDDLDIQIYFPQGWQIYQPEDEMPVKIRSAYDQLQSGGLSVLFFAYNQEETIISSLTYEKLNYNNQQYFEAIKTANSAVLTENDSYQEIEMNNKSAILWQYQTTVNPFTFQDLIFKIDQYNLHLSIWTNKDQFENYAEMINDTIHYTTW